jgi:hypothetical protein
LGRVDGQAGAVVDRRGTLIAVAFAEYFDRNLDAARLLLRGFEPDAFKTLLEQERIGLAFDQSACELAEGRATIDLLTRLLARLYPNIALVPLDRASGKYVDGVSELAASVNPRISISREAKGITRCITVGRTNADKKIGSALTRIYVGSSGWVAKLSASKACGSQDSPNPFGAGAAACIAAANIFRAVFAAQSPGSTLDSILRVSVLDLDHGASKPINPRLKPVNIGETHLVGAGAIGNGFLWAMARLDCTGTLVVVDGEKIARSNLQRYTMAVAGDEGKYKAGVAAAWLSGTRLHVIPERLSWEEFMTARRNWSLDRVAVAVDTPATRINVQAALPRHLFNSWTQLGEVGLSRHEFLGPNACLACLYVPTQPRPNLDQIVLAALRLPPDQLMDVRRRLELDIPSEPAFLEAVSALSGVALPLLLPYEGRPLRELYAEAVCGGAVMEFVSAETPDRAEVPMAFQSALAGILLASDVIAHAGAFRPSVPTITQIDTLQRFPAVPFRPRSKSSSGRCLCADPDFIAAYTGKYGPPA